MSEFVSAKTVISSAPRGSREWWNTMHAKAIANIRQREFEEHGGAQPEAEITVDPDDFGRFLDETPIATEETAAIWAAQRLRFALEESHIPGKFWNARETWRDDYYATADGVDGSKLRQAGARRATQWARAMRGEKLLGDKPGLMFAGNTGSGKSHLAACVAIEFMCQFPSAKVRWWNVPEFFQRLRDTMDKDTSWSEGEVLDTATGKHLLILDDLAAERPSGWVLERLYLVLNRLTEAENAVLIVTTNLVGRDFQNRLKGGKDPDPEMASRIFSRVSGLTQPCAMFPQKDSRI
jgi:chromosomal replication initiation ATPase DnaA